MCCIGVDGLLIVGVPVPTPIMSNYHLYILSALKASEQYIHKQGRATGSIVLCALTVLLA
jgi:hypothetical protein